MQSDEFPACLGGSKPIFDIFNTSAMPAQMCPPQAFHLLLERPCSPDSVGIPKRLKASINLDIFWELLSAEWVGYTKVQSVFKNKKSMYGLVFHFKQKTKKMRNRKMRSILFFVNFIFPSSSWRKLPRKARRDPEVRVKILQ